MLANALLFFMTIVLLAAFVPFSGDMSVVAKSDSIASNFVTYRAAAMAYAVQNPGFSGEAPAADLPLPSGFQQLKSWRNYIDASGVYAYGPIEAGVLDDLATRLHGTRLVGRSQSGNLISSLYGVVDALPSWMPDAQLVSMVRR